MAHYAIWPEGLPDEAYATTSWWASRWNLFHHQLRMLVDVRHARRMRMSVCMEGAPIPDVVEAALEAAGATAPPGGWPERDQTKSSEPRHLGAVFTRTFSVV